MKHLSLIIISLLTAQCLHAGMTLNDCLLYAREHAHTNILGRLEVEKAGADKHISASALMPSVSLSSSGSLSFGRNIDPETNTYDNKQTLSTGFGLNMSLPLFDGLVSVNTLKAARVGELLKIQSAKVEEDRISLEVIRAFYNVSYCRAMVRQMRQQLERDSTDCVATERGLRLGTKSGADVAELQALVASDAYELANQQGLLAKAYLTLRSVMGMPPDSEPLDLMDESDADESVVERSGVHPRVAEARLALRQSEYELKAAKGAYFPRLSLNAGVSTSYYKMLGAGVLTPSFRDQWKDNMGEYVGFSLSIPLFTGLATTNRVKRARIEVRESRTRLHQAEYEIAQATAEAALDLRTAEAELKAATLRLEAEEIAFNAVRRRFELGHASAIDLYTSGAKLATAHANFEGKRIQKIISRITLGYYRGEKLIKE